jgi:hypothetical protein
MPSHVVFDESRLLAHTSEVLDPDIAAVSPDQYEIIDRKGSVPLRPASGQLRDPQVCAAVGEAAGYAAGQLRTGASGVFEGSRVDVTLGGGIAGRSLRITNRSTVSISASPTTGST